MDSSAEAGPSRPSPPRNLTPTIDTSSTDIVMEDVSTTGGGEPDDAVALLLNISTTVDVPSTLSPKPDQIIEDQPNLVEKPAPPDNIQSYPYTPPEEKDANDQPPERSEQIPSIPPPPPSASLSNILTSSSHTDHSSPSAHPPTPTHTSPDPPPKPKGKRKRNTTAGSSRRASADHPPHWLGEDNSIIRCICGFTEDDGFTIQCEGCGAWEHGMCFGYMDEASAPDQYFCELCKPRPFDAAQAKRMQMIMQDQQRLAREAAIVEGEPIVEKEKPRSKSGKTKRARTTENVIEGEVDKDKDSGKEHSPGVMGPPTIKPKRRQPGPKPRIKQNTIESSTPGPSSFKEQPQLPIAEEPEDDFFRIEPWALEYTPIKENIVRGVAARQIMRNVYREWVDAEEEVVAAKSRAVHNPSGLPSPTETGILRLSPDNLFPPPDFHILAPPVPPVYLSGPDLESLASPISIQVVEDAPSFLPLTYAENISKHGVYTRPTIYSVFAEAPITLGAFVGEFKGEVIDCESYRKDPINQYSSLGLPKPHVRSIGPPINLMIDARGYGNDLRFVRSGCHPNVVLRPLLWRSAEGESLKLKFGLFAAKDIGKKDELVLGWEWDDQHVVHSLKSIVHAAMLNDGSLASPGFSASTTSKTINSLSHKIDSVLTHIFGTFTSCACNVPGTCALAQMGQLVEPKMMQGDDVGNGKKKQRVDLGELVGAVRGWRRRELENAEMKKWRLNQGQAFDLGLSRMSSRTSDSHSNPHSQAPSPSRTQTRSVQSDDQQTHEDLEQASSDRAADDSMDQDDHDEIAEEVQQAKIQEATVQQPELPQLEKEDEDTQMEAEEPVEPVEAQPKIEPHTTNATVSEQPAIALPVPATVDFVPASARTPEKSKSPQRQLGVISKPDSPIVQKRQFSSSPAPQTPKSERQGSSSSLSSAMSSIKPSLADGMDSGSESDATTATIPKSQFSASDDESAITSDEEEQIVNSSSPLKAQSSGKAARKVRRVLSPVFESSKYMNGNGNDEDQEMSEEERGMIIKKPRKSGSKVSGNSSGSPIKPVIKMVLSPQGSIRRVGSTKKSNQQNQQQGKRGRTKRILSSSSASDDDYRRKIGEAITKDKDNDESQIGSPPQKKKQKKVSKDIGSSPRSGKSIKLERLETFVPDVAPPSDHEEEPRAIVPDQVTAPMSNALELDQAAIPDPEIVPPAEPQAVPEQSEEEKEHIDVPREATPAPKEPTPPPKEPSPPPEPPKKVSLSDYLKSHKIRKESQTPISEVPPPKVDVLITPEVGGSVAGSFDDIPGFGNISTSTSTPAVNSSPAKAEPETPTMGGKLNLLEHLPSSRSIPSSSATPLVETPRVTTSASSYVPRNVSGGISTDYFPTQPLVSTPAATPTITSTSSSFVPRVSSSYIPRQSSISDNNDSPGSSLGLGLTTSTPNSSYVPRSTISTNEEISKSPINQPVEMPPPLPVREAPPHTSQPPPPPTTPQGVNSNLPGRAPPTGPKVPPTGPRGLGLGTPTSGPGSGPGPITPTSRIDSIPGSGGGIGGGYRGGAPSDRGERGGGRGFGGRGLWGRGRGGGFRGGWRGN